MLMWLGRLPIPHEVLPGGTAEVEGFRHVLAEVRTRFNPGRVSLRVSTGVLPNTIS